MSLGKKYTLGLGTVLAVFVYVLLSEVVPRWADMLQIVNSYTQKIGSVESNENLAARKNNLRVRKAQLQSRFSSKGDQGIPNEIALVNFLNKAARECHIEVQTLSPSEPQRIKQLTVIDFKISCLGGYHPYGQFLNALEEGPFSIQVSNVHLDLKHSSSSMLIASFEGRASFLASEKNR